MNRKHLVLTLLACLNCVHTTHAVEKTPVATQSINQGNGQESLDELLEQIRLHNLGILMGANTNNVEMQRNEGIQREETMQKVYAHMKDELSPNDPRRPLYASWIDRGRDAVKDLSNLESQEVLSFLRERQQAWRDNSTEVPYWDGVGSVPSLSWKGKVIDVDEAEKYMEELGIKYPGIAEQRWGLYRKRWGYFLNLFIKRGNWKPDYIKAAINQLDESNTQIGREMKETVLEKMIKNLDLDKNTVLYQRTVDMLRTDRVLFNLIENYIKQNAEQKMPLVKFLLNKDKITSPALKKLTKNVLMHCANTYLDNVPN